MNKSIAPAFILFFFLAMCLITTKQASVFAEVAENSWVSKAPMNEARWNLRVAVVHEKIYAIGGTTQKGESPYSGGIVGTNEEYDPTTGTWSFKTPMPTPRYSFTVAVYQNKIYCIGGSTTNGGPKTGVNEVYDPATNKWEIKTPMPTPRDNFGIAIYNDKIYLIGGTTGSDYETGLPFYTGVNEVYDPTTNTWETKTPMPTAKIGNAFVVGDKIYFIGGGPNNTLNQVYDPILDSWTTKASMPTEAYGASIAIDNRIYVIGGSYSGNQFYTLIQIYNPETDEWIEGASPPSGGVKQETVIATSGERALKRIYILDDSLRVYDPASDSWAIGPKMPTYRFNFAVAILKDLLYVVGGMTDTYPDPSHSVGEKPIITSYATNEQYTPSGYGAPDPSYLSSPSQSSPTTTPQSTESEPFPVIPVAVASVAAVTVAGAGLATYFRKRSRNS